MEQTREPYRSPRLRVEGGVADLTLANTIGNLYDNSFVQGTHLPLVQLSGE
jgi:hypothetical protein